MIAIQLKECFAPFLDLDLEVWENFEKYGELRTFPKETILKEAYTTEKQLSIIIKGSGGNLIWNKNNFVCIDISFEMDFILDFMSFTKQQPTPIEVRLFEDSTIFSISYQNFQKILRERENGERITRLVTEGAFIDKQQQQIDLLTKSAKERYLELIEQNKITARTPLKYLASYLGITPQSLSRIRSEKI
jgi:signal-transduction protein with cAMP-binding, CBS, and nucleotidyltransferase domain